MVQIRKTVTNLVVRQPKFEEMHKISELARKCYGETHNSFIYDPEKLKEAFLKGDYIPIVGVDGDTGVFTGHVCMMKHPWMSYVQVIELAFLDQDYKSPGLSVKLAEKLVEMIQGNDDILGVMDFCVTTHKMSQRATVAMQMVPCSMFMNLIPEGLDAAQLQTSDQQKGTSINFLRAWDKTLRTVYPPRNHFRMISQIYNWLELPRTLEENPSTLADGNTKLVLRHSPHKKENVSNIILKHIGSDFAETFGAAFSECKQLDKDSVFVLAPLSSPQAESICDHMERQGFSFCGVLPYVIDGEDALLMQWLKNPIKMTEIMVYGDNGRILYDYVLDSMIDSMMRRAQSNG